MSASPSFTFFFFFNDTATTEIYTLSLHDALPIYLVHVRMPGSFQVRLPIKIRRQRLHLGNFHSVIGLVRDRKSTRLNSSHANISYAVFCLQKRIDSHKSSRL